MHKHISFKIAGISLLLMAVSGLAIAETVTETISQAAIINKLHEQDALRVMSLIDRAQRLRALLRGFVDESNQAIAEHNGALPSTYNLRLARALAQPPVKRVRLSIARYFPID